MKKSTPLVSILFFLLIIVLSSCQSIMNATALAAEIGGATGAIDKDLAHSIADSSTAIGDAAEVITPEQEYYIGRAVTGTVLESYKIYSAPKVQAYLNKICGTITANSDMPELYKGYSVAIMDTDEVNAFSSSGGHILVSRGLLKCAQSEDALAAVLAHEIAHIQLKHSIKAIKTKRATNALVKTAGTAFVASGSDEAKELVSTFGDTVNDITQTMVNTGYSKSQEFDADKKALALMAEAGYDVNAMKDMLVLLEKREAGQTKGFSKTHPTPAARIENLKNEYKKYKVKTSRTVRQARFNKIKDML